MEMTSGKVINLYEKVEVSNMTCFAKENELGTQAKSILERYCERQKMVRSEVDFSCFGIVFLHFVSNQISF